MVSVPSPVILLNDTRPLLTTAWSLGFCETADQFHILNGEWSAGQSTGGSVKAFPVPAKVFVYCRDAKMSHLVEKLPTVDTFREF